MRSDRWRGAPAAFVGVCVTVGLVVAAAWAPAQPGQQQPQQAQQATPPQPAAAGAQLEQGITVQKPGMFANLVVFPIHSRVQKNIGQFTTLPKAVKAGTVVIREKGQGGQVSTIVVENKGSRPIVVLAGTIIKGGNQDRQIGHDFVIGAHKTVPVDAFCIEQGRWNSNRSGQQTQGKFTALGTLANRDVQVAGQFGNDQGKVWAEVARANRSNKKSASSGTLLATINDKKLAAKRTKLAAKVEKFLKRRPGQTHIVGLAYAVDGKVRGVRYFMNRQLYQLFATTLVNTMAMEAITAQTVAQAAGKPPKKIALAPSAVKKFVTARRKAKRQMQKKTSGGNVNTYTFSDDGFGASVSARPAPNKPKVRLMEAAY